MFGRSHDREPTIFGKPVSQFQDGKAWVLFHHQDFSRDANNESTNPIEKRDLFDLDAQHLETYTFHKGWVELLPPSQARLMTFHEVCWRCKNFPKETMGYEDMTTILTRAKARWEGARVAISRMVGLR